MTDDTTGAGSNLHHVGSRDDLAPGERLCVGVGNREIYVFNVDGEFHALANYCPHQGGPVCEGTVSGTLGVDDDFALQYEREGRVLSCPWHGWEFDIPTGQALASRKLAIPQYDVVERDGELYVRLRG